MGLETVIQSGVSQKEKNKCHRLTDRSGVEKNGAGESICKAETETQMKRTYGHQTGQGGRGMNWETGVGIYTLLILVYSL